MPEYKHRPLALPGLLVLLTACAPANVVPGPSGGIEPARVTGSVTYRERVALPPTALVTVRLVDVSRADAPADVLAEQSIVAAGKQVPFAFALTYDPGRVDAAHTYAVQARIDDGGRLLFISDTRYPVITRDSPRHADIVLRKVAATAVP